MHRVNPEEAYLNRWAKRCQNNKIIAKRSNLSDWFETWWQMPRNNMSSIKNRLVSLRVHKLPLWLSGVTWPGCLRCRHLECGVALRVYPQWLKYLSKAPSFFLLWSIFALALGLFCCHLIFSACVSLSLTYNIYLSYKQNIFLNK